MEEAGRIFEYLPISFRSESEEEYIKFLWDAFLFNYENKKYQFAFLSFHMIFMCYVYSEIWQIRKNNSENFEKALVGFHKEKEAMLIKATSPFALTEIEESVVFRFFKLIGMDNSDIGKCTKIVKDRNEMTHSNGNIFFRDEKSLELKVEEVFRCIDKIQKCSAKIIVSCYEKFLKESSGVDKREYPDDRNQIREILIYKNYLSRKDMTTLKDYDVQKLAQEQNFANIQSLTATLLELYKEEYDEGEMEEVEEAKDEETMEVEEDIEE